MQSLELSLHHAAILKTYLERAIAELGTEIAATDSREYRDRLKTERRLLQETVGQLASDEEPVGD